MTSSEYLRTIVDHALPGMDARIYDSMAEFILPYKWIIAFDMSLITPTCGVWLYNSIGSPMSCAFFDLSDPGSLDAIKEHVADLRR